jgi:elongation factor P
VSAVATTNDLKNGMVLSLDNGLWAVNEFQHVKPGKGGAFVRTTLKNVLTGKVVDKTFNAGTKVEVATVDKRTMTYLYKEGTDYVFMDQDTFDQLYVPEQTLGTVKDYLLENMEAMVAMHEEAALYVELPASVELLVAHTDPGLQGDRSTGGTKPADARDRRRDPGAAVPHHRREDQGRHPRRALPRPRERQVVGARSKARKRALDVLYEASQRSTDPLATLRERLAQSDPPVPEYATELVEGVALHQERIDELLATYAEHWTLDRMPPVDLAALRIGRVRAALARRRPRRGRHQRGGRAGRQPVHRREHRLRERPAGPAAVAQAQPGGLTRAAGPPDPSGARRGDGPEVHPPGGPHSCRSTSQTPRTGRDAWTQGRRTRT